MPAQIEQASRPFTRLPRSPQNQGVSVTFQQLPKAVIAAQNHQALQSFAETFIGDDTKNKVISTSTSTDSLDRQKQRQTKQQSLSHEHLESCPFMKLFMLTLAAKFNRNITQDNDFSAIRYQWVSYSKCSHCNIIGHNIKQCSTLSIDWQVLHQPALSETTTVVNQYYNPPSPDIIPETPSIQTPVASPTSKSIVDEGADESSSSDEILEKKP